MRCLVRDNAIEMVIGFFTPFCWMRICTVLPIERTKITRIHTGLFCSQVGGPSRSHTGRGRGGGRLRAALEALGRLPPGDFFFFLIAKGHLLSAAFAACC